MKNLLCYVSKDKVGMLDLQAVSGPGGGYKTIKNWLKDQAEPER